MASATISRTEQEVDHYRRLKKLEALLSEFRATAELKMKTRSWSDFEIKVIFRDGLISHFEIGDRTTCK